MLQEEAARLKFSRSSFFWQSFLLQAKSHRSSFLSPALCDKILYHKEHQTSSHVWPIPTLRQNLWLLVINYALKDWSTSNSEGTATKFQHDTSRAKHLYLQPVIIRLYFHVPEMATSSFAQRYTRPLRIQVYASSYSGTSNMQVSPMLYCTCLWISWKFRLRELTISAALGSLRCKANRTTNKQQIRPESSCWELMKLQVKSVPNHLWFTVDLEFFGLYFSLFWRGYITNSC